MFPLMSPAFLYVLTLPFGSASMFSYAQESSQYFGKLAKPTALQQDEFVRSSQANNN